VEATSLRFATAARTLGRVTRRRDLILPGFRSPPRAVGADRTMRRRGDGAVMVAVRLRGRPWSAVVSDMVEGVVVSNRLTGTEADAARRALWAALESDGLLPATADEVSATVPARGGAPRSSGRRHLRVAGDVEAA